MYNTLMPNKRDIVMHIEYDIFRIAIELQSESKWK